MPLYPETIELFEDASFSSMSVKDYIAKRKNINKEQVEDEIFKALPEGQQTSENRELINKAINKSVNASGATILLANTTKGSFIIAATSQRRKIVLAANGACEKEEASRQTGIRETFEELGNPPANGVIRNLVSSVNLRSVGMLSKIEDDFAALANRILAKKPIYINFSAIYSNIESIEYQDLQREIDSLSNKLNQGASYYNSAVNLVFGKQKSLFESGQLTKEAIALINEFKANCFDNITENFNSFAKTLHDETMSVEAIKNSLLVLIDLTENDKVQAISLAELEKLLSTEPAEWSHLNYFPTCYDNFTTHNLSNDSPQDFLAQFTTHHSTGRPTKTNVEIEGLFGKRNQKQENNSLNSVKANKDAQDSSTPNYTG